MIALLVRLHEFLDLAILQGRNRFDARQIGLRNPVIGLARYALFFWLHPMLFGIRAY
jgi:uncharacterized membrane protein